MRRTRKLLASALGLAVFLLANSVVWAQIDLGDFTVSGSAEVGGLPRSLTGSKAKFEEYRDIPESVIVPELQLMIGGKKEDFYLKFDAGKVGRDDQNFTLRFGRYGLVDVEFEWDQIPHLFSHNVARTPYTSSNGGGTLTINRTNSPITFPLATGQNSCATSPVCQWLNANDHPLDLSLYNGIGRFKIRYTPTPGWTFSGSYWSNNNVGKRAFGAVFASSPGSYNITELPEPIDYQTHNIELGGEYAGKGWSIGLKYNASLFHNNTSTLVWDNPIHTAPGGVCTDGAAYSNTTGTGPCRGRLDLYPSNQAHTFSLVGTAQLPFKTNFMGTVSYGWRLQDDNFLPATINSAIAAPAISHRSLDGDVRPLMINASLVNHAFMGLNLKAFYRLYDLDNQSNKVTLNGGWILNDQGAAHDPGLRIQRFGYSKQNAGFEAGYAITRWLAAKWSYGWEHMHRDIREANASDEHSIGPTFDIKPLNWMLFRLAYKHSWRDAPGYNDGTTTNISRKFYEAKRDRDRVSLFTDISPWETLAFHGGFEFTGESYPDTTLGTQNDRNFSPSVGFIYAPSAWLRFFGDYNFDLFSWRLDAMQRTSTTQDPNDPACPPTSGGSPCSARLWTSRGRDKVHTFSFGSDLDIIKDLLGMRIQYTFSQGVSQVHNSGSTCLPLAPASGGCTQATDFPDITNTWHELLARFEYQLHKHLALRFGYYFNKANEKDFGVDIMKPWMGDVLDPQSSASSLNNLQRSIFLGDRIKGPFTAHVGFMTVRLKF